MCLLDHCFEKTVAGIVLQRGRTEHLKTGGNETERQEKRERTDLLVGSTITRGKPVKNVWEGGEEEEEVESEGKEREITSAGKVLHLLLTETVAIVLPYAGPQATINAPAETTNLKEEAAEEQQQLEQ
jgi:hypothetical protein